MLPVVTSPAPDARPDLRSLSFDELGALVQRLGERPFRARQLFRWLHHKGVASLGAMTDLPKALRERLAVETQLTTLTMDLVQQSIDGTRKYRFRTWDHKLIESVYMPDAAQAAQAFDPEIEDDERDDIGDEAVRRKKRVRRTLCVSTQVGCAMGCRFCMTATMGLVRNLSAGEIADQVYRVNQDLRELAQSGAAPAAAVDNLDPQRPLTNLVYMGMGEPLHNFDNVKRSLDLLLHEDGANFSHRHVTVSTSGLVPAIARLGDETQVKLAVSLNATTDEQRARLMPVDKKWNIAALLEACRRFPMKMGRRITFEYVLLKDTNDADADAERLSKLVAGIPAKVNLIPYNENPGLGFGDPGTARAEEFRRLLEKQGVTAMIRKNRGRDIAAACGQLAVEGQKRERVKH